MWGLQVNDLALNLLWVLWVRLVRLGSVMVDEKGDGEGKRILHSLELENC
jgi:hypothetical protein